MSGHPEDKERTREIERLKAETAGRARRRGTRFEDLTLQQRPSVRLLYGDARAGDGWRYLADEDGHIVGREREEKSGEKLAVPPQIPGFYWFRSPDPMGEHLEGWVPVYLGPDPEEETEGMMVFRIGEEEPVPVLDFHTLGCEWRPLMPPGK